jgi:tetratricopeptide (TPR) repeat protein
MHFLTIVAAAAGFASVSPDPDSVPLYKDLGDFHHEITTDVPLAQAYFDQGMRLTFAFNHQEAIVSFQYAAELDASCAMCWWGVALALGPNINAPMTQPAGRAALEAVRRAQSLLDDESALERAYIEALATRYSADAPDARASLDSAYASAMGAVVSRFPDDLTAATLYAEALMDLSPWNYWSGLNAPRAGTDVIVAQLERVMAANPDHPGACHYYIHAVEQYHPELAVECAERLAALMPGAGHLVHMPAHIYIRVGRYADAVHSNEHAIHADETYVADRGREGFYQLAYYPHNYHFLSLAAMLAGQKRVALSAAAALGDDVPVEIAVLYVNLQEMHAYLHLARLAFGEWSGVLDLPLPDPSLRYATALAWYARGVAASRTGSAALLAQATDSVATIAALTTDEPFRSTTSIALEILRAEHASARGVTDDAIAHLQRAIALEDGLQYMEPPFWHKPVRHMLGATLLRERRFADAERAYREDLQRFPNNGWALHGLVSALEGQGRTTEAAQARAALRAAWATADVTLPASTF